MNACQDIKKTLSRIGLFLKTKNRTLFFVFIFLLLSLFFPFPAKAGLLSWIGGLLMSVPGAFIGLIFSVLALIIAALASLAAGFLAWVTTGINISYTKNAVVLAGFSVTQSLANMFLVLVLVYIGIATMLRLAGYETKKLLRNFIIIALLINFAPVILGMAIDAANILMNYFLSRTVAGGGSTIILNQLSSTLNELGSMWTDIFSFNPAQQIAGMTKAVVITILNVVLFFILMAFALVFLARMMMLWILIILAPLAFVFWILPIPRIREYYDKWLNSFIDWTTLGIVLSFFLYLGNVATTISFGAPKGENGNILALIVPVIFYVIALQMGLSMGKIGSSIVAGLKKGGKASAMTTGRIAWQGVKRGTTRVGGAISSEFNTLRTIYSAGRVLGLPKSQAIGVAARTYWQTRVVQPARATAAAVKAHPIKAPLGAVGAAIKGSARAVRDIAKGSVGAARDIAMAGVRAGFGIKIKKKGLRTCPTCGNPRVAASATACPTCGHVF